MTLLTDSLDLYAITQFCKPIWNIGLAYLKKVYNFDIIGVPKYLLIMILVTLQIASKSL